MRSTIPERNSVIDGCTIPESVSYMASDGSRVEDVFVDNRRILPGGEIIGTPGCGVQNAAENRPHKSGKNEHNGLQPKRS